MEAEVQLTVEAYEANIAQARADERAKMIEAGWVKLSEDQGLPKYSDTSGYYIVCNYINASTAQQDMLKAGWRKVEVKDGTNSSRHK